MKMRRNLLALVPAVLGTLLLSAPMVAAQEAMPRLLLRFPAGASVGKETILEARLQDASGGPIQGATLTLYAPAAFLNTVDDEVTLGRATTDKDGLARFRYTPHREGKLAITVRFVGRDRRTLVEETATLSVVPGPDSYVETAPLRVPGLNYRLLILLLGGTWGLYLVAIAFLWKVSRTGGKSVQEPDHA
ncbi:MAG: hypothetical protein HYX95_02090 [Chloroflexi bacterium]|nr:hypothetical protein [Chloroflexota bacterium]